MRPGKPTDDAYIESLNGSFRDECLNKHMVHVSERCANDGEKLETRL
jgi:hypothetical protein